MSEPPIPPDLLESFKEKFAIVKQAQRTGNLALLVRHTQVRQQASCHRLFHSVRGRHACRVCHSTTRRYRRPDFLK